MRQHRIIQVDERLPLLQDYSFEFTAFICHVRVYGFSAVFTAC